MCLAVIGLYVWQEYFSKVSLAQEVTITLISAAIAVVGLVLAIVTKFWLPERLSQASVGLSYILTTTIIVSLLFNNQLITASAFIVLWPLVALLSGAIGVMAISLVSFCTIGFMVWLSLRGELNVNETIAIIFGGFLPILVGVLLWRRMPRSVIAPSTIDEPTHDAEQSASKSELVVNGIHDGVIAIDSQGIIELINPAAQQLIGWSKQDSIKLNYKSVLRLVDNLDHDIKPSQDPIQIALTNNRESSTSELNVLDSRGTSRQVSIVVTPAGGKNGGAILVLRDITKEQQREKEQAEFISTASHEMRTPVAAIEGYLGLVLSPKTAQIDERAREYAVKAHESAQHLGRLFQNLLDISKSDDSRLSNNPEIIDLVEFTDGIVQGLQPMAKQKNLRLLYIPTKARAQREQNVKVPAQHLHPIFYINADKDHLREVLSNLIENAIKYTPQGSVTVDISGDTELARISIQDTGIGISRDDQAHLFQKFYRIDNSDTRTIGGTGLGLYLSKRLTEHMNGKLWVESEQGKGSTFFVEFSRMDHDIAVNMMQSGGNEVGEYIAPVESTEPANIPVATPIPPTLSPATPQPAMPSPTPQPEPTMPPAPVVVAPQAPQPAVQAPAPVNQPPQPAAQLPPPPPAVAARPTITPPPSRQPAQPLNSSNQRSNVSIDEIERNKMQYARQRANYTDRNSR